MWGSVSNGANLFLVGLLVSSKGIEVSFLVFLVGIISFVLLSMFIKFDSHMIDQMSITDTHDSTINNAAREGNERDSLLSRRLPRNNSYNDVIAQPLHHGNYLYNPLEHSAMKLQDSRHSSFISRWNSVANTEYLGDENANLYQTTSVAALDVQMEANELLTNILSNDNRPVTFPPLGLALSNVPTIDTSLSAFAAVGNPGSDAPEKSTLKNCVVQTFLVSVLLFGIAYSMICQFLFLLFRDLGMDASLMGLIGPIGGIAEVVTFWLFKQVI